MSQDTNNISIIGYASGNAAQDNSCCMGPIIMEKSDKLTNTTWLGQIYPTDSCKQLGAIDSTFNCCQKLAQHTMSLTQNNKQFVVIGGDHSCAIGTWSGASAAKESPIGMIWIDAHLDAHNNITSKTKNIHGMALSSLIDNGPKKLNNLIIAGAKIDCKNLVIIGARDYETEEQELLTQLGVKIFYMNEIVAKGLNFVFKQALQIATANKNGFGISIDIDGLDPNHAPATAITSSPGIVPEELIHEFKTTLQQHKHKLIGLEIAEFFPDFDKNCLTEQVIADLIEAAYRS